MRYVQEKIYSVIPNRYPLMFLDSMDVEENHVTAFINLESDTWFFACHYPDYPIMPLSLLIESMTQTFSATFLANTPPPPESSSAEGNPSHILYWRNRWRASIER